MRSRDSLCFTNGERCLNSSLRSQGARIATSSQRKALQTAGTNVQFLFKFVCSVGLDHRLRAGPSTISIPEQKCPNKNNLATLAAPIGLPICDSVGAARRTGVPTKKLDSLACSTDIQMPINAVRSCQSSFATSLLFSSFSSEFFHLCAIYIQWPSFSDGQFEKGLNFCLWCVH